MVDFLSIEDRLLLNQAGQILPSKVSLLEGLAPECQERVRRDLEHAFQGRVLECLFWERKGDVARACRMALTPVWSEGRVAVVVLSLSEKVIPADLFTQSFSAFRRN